MGDEKVGDVVWYRGEGMNELAEVISIQGTRTHATIRGLTGEIRGHEFEAPWDIIQSVRKTTEFYREYSIEVSVRPLKDGTFTSGGFIRKSNSEFTGLPFETSFETTERHPSEDAARRAGIGFAKKKIDGN